MPRTYFRTVRASATHCASCMPFHTAQLALNGLRDVHITEAGWVGQRVTGARAYLYTIGSSHAQFLQARDRAVTHIKQADEQG